MVMVLELFEILLIMGAVYLIITQAVIPLILNKPCWTLFRKESKLRAELREARQSVAESRLKEEVKKTKDRV
jgi:hypothetical protein